MCAGKFVDSSNIELNNLGDLGASADLALQTQVAMATETGAIYIMANFEVGLFHFMKPVTLGTYLYNI